jgi:hypothetical protein
VNDPKTPSGISVPNLSMCHVDIIHSIHPYEKARITISY